jgi:hypothetical protein
MNRDSDWPNASDRPLTRCQPLGTLKWRSMPGVAIALISLIGCAPLKSTSSGAASSGTTRVDPPAGTAAHPAASPTVTESPPADAPAPESSPSRTLPASPAEATVPEAQPIRPTEDAGATASETGAAVQRKSDPRSGGKGVAPSKPPPVASLNRPTRPDSTVQVADNPRAPPALDLKSLEQRLRDTHALGVFTKLSLKNQVDALLDEFRDFHRGKIPPPLSELQREYNVLLARVLTLLKDDDASLAAAISSSRDAIWGILTDPEKFAKL